MLLFYKIISLLLQNNFNVSICYAGYLICDPHGATIHRLRTTGLETKSVHSHLTVFHQKSECPGWKAKCEALDPWVCLLGHTKALGIATLPRSRLLQCSYWVMGSVASPTLVQTKTSLLVHFFFFFLKSFPRTDGIPWLQGKVPSDGACLFNEKNLIIWFCLPLVLYFSFYPPPSFLGFAGWEMGQWLGQNILEYLILRLFYKPAWFM